MKVRINGEIREFRDLLKLNDSLNALSIKPTGIAIELNKEVVARDRWPTTILADGDTIEIVHFVGGGL